MSTEPIHVLIVDDTPQNLVTLEAILDDPGIVLVPAKSGREALRCLLRQDFAAILLDVDGTLAGFHLLFGHSGRFSSSMS